MTEWRAPALTQMAAAWLALKNPEALIVEELSIGNWGSLRLDVAAITETGIEAVEVKGDGDDMSRLRLQGPLYALVARRSWLLASPALHDRSRKARPHGWGLLHLDETKGLVKADRHVTAQPLPNSPGQMLQALWAVELRRLCDELGVARKGMTCCDEWSEALSEAVPLGQLRPAVCRTLRARDWYPARPSGVSGGERRPGQVRWARELL